MPDSVPNYLTVDSAGAVSANFPGGVTIDPQPGTPPLLPTDIPPHSVSWVRTGTGWVAQVGGYYDQATDGRAVRLAASPPAGFSNNYANLDLISATGGSVAQLEAQTVLAGVPSSTTQRQVIGVGGYSDFTQISNGISGTIGGVLGTPVVNFWGGYVFNINRPALNGLLFHAQGSAYLPAGAGGVEYELFVDGVFVGKQAFFFNNPSMHMTLPMITGKTYAPFPAGNHTIQFSNPISSLAVDNNDACSASWIG